MSATHARSRPNWRQYALMLVVLMAMTVSIFGQVAVVAPLIGTVLAFVLALTNDFGAVLATEAVMSAARGSAIRRWGWVAILLAFGTGAALNARHASVPAGTPLPTELAILVGVEPITLVLVLVHLIGLVLADQQADPDACAGAAETSSSAGAPSVASTASTTASDREISAARPRDPAARSITADREIHGGADRENDHGWAREATARSAASTAGPVAAASLVATTGAPSRERSAVRETRDAAAGSGAVTGAVAAPAPGTTPLPRRAIAAVPELLAELPEPERPDWMSDDLIRAVVRSALAAGAPERQYGEPAVRRDHRLPDGSPITSYRAQVILRFVREHDLLRRLEASA